MTKWEFVEDQMISNSILAALQRANVYADPVAYTDQNRKKLRDNLADLLRDFANQYKTSITSDKHKENIRKIADDLTARFRDKNLLRNDRFRIGIAQKALNLYLKYLWSLDKIARPPHCPFDFGIIAKLPLTDQQKKDLQWTELDSLDDYQALVDAGMEKIKVTGHASLADWELAEWR